jgi:hypothetical protein
MYAVVVVTEVIDKCRNFHNATKRLKMQCQVDEEEKKGKWTTASTYSHFH